MYVCGNCQKESEFPVECEVCNESMTCESCHGTGCQVCEETELFKE